MIDNLKIRLNSQKKTEEYIKSTGDYTQSFWIGRNDTENKYPLKKKVDNLELRVTEQNSVLSNSLHKYYNINKYKCSTFFYSFCTYFPVLLDIN